MDFVRESAPRFLEILRAQIFDRIGQGIGGIVVRPQLLIIQNDAVHIAATNPDHRRATGLTFQGDEAEGFLHTGMNEQIRRAIEPRQLKRIAAVAPPRHRPATCLELLQLITLGTIPDYQEVILVRPAVRPG